MLQIKILTNPTSHRAGGHYLVLGPKLNSYRAFLVAIFNQSDNECPAYHRTYSEPFEYSADLPF